MYQKGGPKKNIQARGTFQGAGSAKQVQAGAKSWRGGGNDMGGVGSQPLSKGVAVGFAGTGAGDTAGAGAA